MATLQNALSREPRDEKSLEYRGNGIESATKLLCKLIAILCSRKQLHEGGVKANNNHKNSNRK